MHSTFSSRLHFCRTLAFASLLGLGGCSTGDVAMMATISGGEKLRVPMGQGGIPPTVEGGVKIDVCTFIPKENKTLTYLFQFTDTKKRARRSVKVEDVSDDAPIVLVQAADPKLSATGQWHGESEPIAQGNPRIAWLVTLPNSLRVYRFTLTFADGQTLVLLQGSMFPAPMKSAARHVFGEKY
jgi:hypothetical protein